MKIEQVKPGVFCRHYKDRFKLYQIFGIAKTDDVFFKHKYHKMKPDFFAYDVESKNPIPDAFVGFIFSQDNIIISLNRNNSIIGDTYILYRSTGEDSRIWAREKNNFTTELEKNGEPFKRFHLL